MLLDREQEFRELERAVAEARAGRGAAVVLLGEAGIGKSSLLCHVHGLGSGMRAVALVGVQSEMEVAYAGLQPLVDELAAFAVELPKPQRAVVDGLLGRRAPRPMSRFVVGLTLVSLLSAASKSAPVLLTVDDLQWVDRASAEALAFAARRIEHDRVAVVLALRPRSHLDRLTTFLPTLSVRGLSLDASLQLLRSTPGAPKDPDVAARLAMESHGNPLVLIEAIRLASARPGLTTGPASGAESSSWLEKSYRARVGRMPSRTRTLLLLAACDPTGDPALLWRAASSLHLKPEDLDAAVADGLLALGSVVAFAHPLIRSSIYRYADPDDRRRAHLALAHATPRSSDRDRRAWHLACAAIGPDEDIAQELERCAEQAMARGGLFSAAAFLERAAMLTADGAARARRSVQAAVSKEMAGDHEAAARLLEIAERGPLDEATRARVTHVRGRIGLLTKRGAEAAATVLRAAELMSRTDPAQAAEIYLEALSAALFASGYPSDSAVSDFARAGLRHLDGPGAVDSGAVGALLRGLAESTLAEDGVSASRSLGVAVTRFLSDDVPPEDALRWTWLACRAAALTWDDNAWPRLVERGVALAREAGSLSVLATVLASGAGLAAWRGDLQAAALTASEGELAWRALGIEAAPYGSVVVAAWSGRRPGTRTPAQQHLAALEAKGEGMGIALVHWAEAMILNSEGRWDKALAHAKRAAEHPKAMLYSVWALPELVEAASRTGDTAMGRDALAQLRDLTGGTDSPWGAGVLARCEALLADMGEAEEHYEASVALLSTSRMRAELGRTVLLYGEWLRRAKHRSRAREQLLTASSIFETMGAEGFARRAAAESAASGARISVGREPDARRLTPQEERVARLAATGSTNAEIAAQLYVSPSTVDYHLRKVYDKLGVDSRTQLHLVLPP